MMATKSASLWDLLETITYKDNWYSKVFNEKIVDKWQKEITNEFKTTVHPGTVDDMFQMGIGILRATAQGANMYPNTKECEWDAYEFCKPCIMRAEQIVRDDPEEYGYEEGEDIEKFINDREWFDDYFDTPDNSDFCSHSTCTCIGPDSLLENYAVYKPDSLITDSQRISMKQVISNMMNKLPVDWHPGSDEQVRDIIHPSMYPYIKGVSSTSEPSTAETFDERVRYQWLPSDISVNEDGKVKFVSYINNLRSDLFPDFVPLTETFLEKFIPSFNEVLKRKLEGKNLQVIVKVASIHLDLTKFQYPGGSWHIEGMPYEHIVATGLHYLTVENITDSFLEFRKPVVIHEEGLNYPQSDVKFTKHHYGLEKHFDGEMNRYLGLIKCLEGASVVFPNTLQHHVKDFSAADNCHQGTRIILAFFLIDPDHKIISTADVLPQQADFPGKLNHKTFTKKEADFHRDRLMYHRKFFVDEMNEQVYEREYSLCEH